MKRTKEFQTSQTIDSFIEMLNAAVAEGEQSSSARVEREDWPILFIVAPPRSGTTVFTQWLHQCGFTTPLNLTARFYKNPYTGGLIQRLLTDKSLHYRNELTCDSGDHYLSEYGKTSGCLAPHEFSHYFRRFFPHHAMHMNLEQAKESDPEGFVDGLNLFATATQKPVVIKGFLVQYNLELLTPFENIIFVHCHRSVVDNICSLVGHRKKVAGNIHEWVSVKPPGFNRLTELNPYEQIAAQVLITNDFIEKQFESIPKERRVSLKHEFFCEDPCKTYTEIDQLMVKNGYAGLARYEGPDKFDISRYEEHSEDYVEATKAVESIMGMKNEILAEYFHN